METRRPTELRSRALTEFDSRGATISFVADGDAFVVRVELEPGGRVGLHPAAADQLLVVTSGTGEVRSGEGESAGVRAGDVVRWAAGEQHETSSDDGLVAVVVEAPRLLLIDV